MEAAIDGVACPMIDVSRTNVRLLWPSALAGHPATVDLSFTLPTVGARRKHTAYTVAGRLLRPIPLELVHQYVPPRPHWSAMLRGRDTFAQTSLVRS